MKQRHSFHALLSPAALGLTLLLTIGLVLGTTTLFQKGSLTVDGVVRTDIPANARIIRVTNLHADGAGSLTEALLASGPRVVVFEVGGTIDFRSASAQRPFQLISITNGDLVIAGETAPSPGIHLIGAPLEIRASNIVIRHLSIYTGTKFPYFLSSDAIKINAQEGQNARNILVENNAFYWAIDETGELWTDPVGFEVGRIRDVTFRNNIFGEALLAMNQGTDNPEGALHKKGPHSNGFLISHGAQRIIFEKNLFASNYRRNPWITGDTTVLLLNNIIYNPDRHAVIFSGGPTYGGQDVIDAETTAIGNVCVVGPDTQGWLTGEEDEIPKMFFGAPGSVGPNTKLFLQDNAFLRADKNEIGKDWNVFHDDNDPKIISHASSPMTWTPLSNFTILPSADVFASVLSTVGPRPFDTTRPHTSGVLSGVRDGTHHIVNIETDVGGYPMLSAVNRPFSIATLLQIPLGYLTPLPTIGASSASSQSPNAPFPTTGELETIRQFIDVNPTDSIVTIREMRRALKTVILEIPLQRTRVNFTNDTLINKDDLRLFIAGVQYLLTCGNAEVNDREECDDGNTQSGDGCSAICKREITSTSSTSSTSSQAPVTLPPTIGQWIMNRTTLTPDASGRGNTLTIVGSVPKVTLGEKYAASFSGNISNYLTANPSGTLNMDGSSYTLSAWMKPTSIENGINGILTKGNKGRFGDVPFQLYQENGIVKFTIGDSSIQPEVTDVNDPNYMFSKKSRADVVVYPTPIAAGQWSHVVAWYDNGNYGREPDTINLSVNGGPTITVPARYTSGYEEFTDSTPFFIGKMFSQGPFNGLIDSVQMWKTILTENERRSLFTGNPHQ